MTAPGGAVVMRAQLPLRSAYAAPRTPTESTLARIWTAALSMDRVGIDDRYQELGGDSLAAAAIFTAIAETFATDFRPAMLAQAPTIALLAAKIDAMKSPAK